MNLIVFVFFGVLVVLIVLILVMVRRLRYLREERDKAEIKAEEITAQFKEEQARFQASITNLPLGYLMTTVEGTIFAMNDTFKQILQLSSAVTTVSDIDKLYPSLNLSVQIKSSMDQKKKIMTENGFGEKFLHVFISPILISEQSVIGAVILIEDITEHMILERSKDEFFSIASHELRTPLTAIRGNTALLKQYYADKLDDSNFSEMVGDIHEASVRLIEIVNDFLSVSRLEQGKMKFDILRVDLARSIIEVIEELKNQANEKNIYLKFEIGSAVWVMADKNKLKEVLVNLIGNAIKFTDSGGISVEVNEVGQDQVKAVVSDTGMGIPFAQRGLLFRKFQQAGQNIVTRDATRGTGLGLYISKLLVEGMGGQIKLESSEEGKGTSFSFTLKLASA